MVYSIGYGGRTQEGLISLLLSNGISYLLDVRTYNSSPRFPAFSGRELNKVLGDNDIRYLFLGDTLGGKPSNESLYTNGAPDYEKMSCDKSFLLGIQRIINAESLNLNICLLCSEKDPRKCHRAKLIGEKLALDGLNVSHIDKDDLIVKQSNLFNKEQQLLF